MSGRYPVVTVSGSGWSHTREIVRVTPRQRIGRWMREQRARLDLSARAVAEGTSFSHEALRSWERGQRMPGVELFVAWCQALGIEPSAGIRMVAAVMGEQR